MVNKPIPYSFDYSLSRESESFKSGIEKKPYPYRFNHAVGLSHGSYRFKYDRKDKLYIEKQALRYIKSQSQITIEDGETYYVSKKGNINVENDESSYVSSKCDINKDNTESSYISSRGNIDISNFEFISIIERREIIKNKYKILSSALNEMCRENKDYLVSSVVHEIKKDVGKELPLKVSRANSIMDKEYDYSLIKPENNTLVKEQHFILERIKDLMEKENNFIASKDNDFIYKENNLILEKIDDLLYKNIDKTLGKDSDLLVKNKDIALCTIISTLVRTNGERRFITPSQGVYKSGSKPPLMRSFGEINNIGSSALFYRLNEMKKDSYEFTSFREASILDKDNYELLSFKETNEMSLDNSASLLFKGFKDNLNKDTLEKILFRNFIKDDLIKDVFEKRLYLGRTKESILEETTLIYKNLEGKEINIYEEVLYKRWHSDIEKEIIENDGFAIFIDGEIELNTKMNVLELIRDIDIHKSLNKMKLEAVNRTLGKELDSKQISKLPIGDIFQIANDIKLEKIHLAEVIKEDNLISLTYKASKEIIKGIGLRQLEDIAVKEIENNLTDTLLDVERMKELSSEMTDRLVSKNDAKEVIKDVSEVSADITRQKNIEVEVEEFELEVRRIKDLEIDNQEIRLILERIMILEKDIKETLLVKNHEKEAFLDNYEALATKNYFKDAHIDDRENLMQPKPYKDLEVNRYEYYYRAIIPIIKKSEDLLIEKGIEFMSKEIVDIVMEKIEKDISLTLEPKLEKAITNILEKDSLEKLLEKEISKLLEKDISENLLEKLVTKLLSKDNNDTLMDGLFGSDMEFDIHEFLLDRIRNDMEIHLEHEDNKLDKNTIKEIIEGCFDDEHLLDLVNDILIEINKESTLSPSTKDIMTYIFKELEKQNKEIALDESLPLVKLHREIKGDNKKISLERIETLIGKEKRISLSKEFINIEKHKEKNVELYKRFWFLRATDPLDWKIVPYNNFPYEDEPVIFDEGKKMIPDNWQLEMSDVENKLFNKIDKNPVPFGKDASNTEIALSIEIMIEMINVLILLWSRLFYAFTGYTGTQSVTRITRTLYEWLTLETSIDSMEDKKSKEHYMRAYRWIRWEAEKVSIKAREDMSLNGNFYIDEFIFELIHYMENHHFDAMPLFEVVEVMDEYRALIPSDEPQGDIEFVLDKVKGMRHKILDCREERSNE